MGGEDLPQGHPVLAGQGHVQGAGGGLVRFDRRAHAPRVGLADRPGQRVGLGGVEPAQRVRPLPQDAGVEVGQFGVLSQHLGQEGGPPAVGQLGVQVVVGDAAIGQVRHEGRQAQLVEVGHDPVELGHLLGGGVVVGQGAHARQEVLQRQVHEPGGVGPGAQDRLEVLDGVAGLDRRGLHGVQALRQARPAPVGIVGAPGLAPLLDLDQLGVQVLDWTPRTHQVLGLLEEAATFRPGHLHGVLLAPLARGRGDQHVGGGALENLGEEDVEGLAHAVEHLQLLAPLVQGRGPRHARGVGDVDAVVAHRGQEVVRQAAELGQGVRGLVDVRHVNAVPRGGGDLRLHDAQVVGAVEQAAGAGHAGPVQALQVPGGDPGGGADAAPRRQLGQVLERLVGGHAPGLAAQVEGVNAAGQPLAHGAQPLAQIHNGGHVQLGRLGAQALLDLLGRVAAPGRVLGEVEDQAAQAHVAQRLGDGVTVGAGGGHVQHGAPGGGGVGDDGRQGGGDVGSGRGVQQDGGAGAHGLDGVELTDVEIAGAALALGGAVLRVGLGQGDVEGGAGVRVSGQRRDEGGGAGPLHGGVEVLDQGLAGVDEGADDEVLTDQEAGQVLAAEGADAVQGGARGEPLRAQGGVGHRLNVRAGPGPAQGAGEDGVDLDRGVEGEGGVGAGGGQADRAQEDRDLDGPRARPRLRPVAGDLRHGDGDVVGLRGDRSEEVRTGSASCAAPRGGRVAEEVRSGLNGDGADPPLVLRCPRLRRGGDDLHPGGDPNGEVDGGDAELAGQLVGASGDLAQALAGDAQGAAFAHETGQVGGAAGVELGEPGGVGGGEVDDAVELGDVIQARRAAELNELFPPGAQGLLNESLAALGGGRAVEAGHGRRIDGGRGHGPGPAVLLRLGGRGRGGDGGDVLRLVGRRGSSAAAAAE